MADIRQIEDFLTDKKAEYRTQTTGDVQVDGFSSLHNYREGTLTWIKSADKWHEGMPEIALAIVQEGVELPLPNQIICNNSKAVFFSILEHFFAVPAEDEEPIGQNTVIGRHVKLGRNVKIGHNCSITGDVTIGDGTVISDNVVIRNRVRIGQRCTIQAHVMLGEDGYGIYKEEGRPVMVRHYGGVWIGDDVFIGSHSDIERGTIDDTYIGDGVKIGPYTLIGHNTRIEQDAELLCSQIYGSVSIGERTVIVGSIVKNQCSIGNDSLIGIGSAVLHDIEAGKVAVGMPARVIRDNDIK